MHLISCQTGRLIFNLTFSLGAVCIGNSQANMALEQKKNVIFKFYNAPTPTSAWISVCLDCELLFFMEQHTKSHQNKADKQLLVFQPLKDEP